MATSDPGGEIVKLMSKASLAKILECPVCKETPFPPIFNCQRGHLICKQCRPKLSSCALCRDKFSDGRNFVAESIIRSSKFTCKYLQKGCDKQVSGEFYEKHLNECPFSPNSLSCRLHPCLPEATFQYADYLKHLKTVHKIIGKDETTTAALAINNSVKDFETDHVSRYYYIQSYGKVFLIRTFRITSNTYWNVSLVGPEDEASKFYVTVTLQKSLQSPVPKFEMTVPVSSIKATELEIKDSLAHAVLPAAHLVGFSTEKVLADDMKKYKYTVRYHVHKH